MNIDEENFGEWLTICQIHQFIPYQNFPVYSIIFLIYSIRIPGELYTAMNKCKASGWIIFQNGVWSSLLELQFVVKVRIKICSSYKESL